MPISEAMCIKHDYAKPKKRKVQPVEDYDPRPPAFRGTAADRLPALLDELRGEQLCISLLFDAKCGVMMTMICNLVPIICLPLMH